jgi:hypothetical protein
VRRRGAYPARPIRGDAAFARHIALIAAKASPHTTQTRRGRHDR